MGRKRRIGRNPAHYVVAMIEAAISPDPVTGDTTLSWLGPDEREGELEVVASALRDAAEARRSRGSERP